MSHQGFLDTRVEVLGYGHVYLCASCVGEAARKLGHVEPRVAAVLRQEIADGDAEVARLRGQVAFEQEHKTVSAADLAAFVRQNGHDEEKPLELTEHDPRTHDLCACGQAKNRGSKRCRSCHTARLNAKVTA